MEQGNSLFSSKQSNDYYFNKIREEFVVVVLILLKNNQKKVLCKISEMTMQLTYRVKNTKILRIMCACMVYSIFICMYVQVVL